MMAHHGDASDEMMKAMNSFFGKKMAEEARSQNLGATGEFPDGRLGSNDEGEIRFGVAADKGQVVLNFGKPVAWIASPPEYVRALAMSLLEAADKADE